MQLFLKRKLILIVAQIAFCQIAFSQTTPAQSPNRSPLIMKEPVKIVNAGYVDSLLIKIGELPINPSVTQIGTCDREVWTNVKYVNYQATEYSKPSDFDKEPTFDKSIGSSIPEAPPANFNYSLPY